MQKFIPPVPRTSLLLNIFFFIFAVQEVDKASEQMLKCSAMSEPKTDNIGDNIPLVANQLKGIGDKLNWRYAENEPDALENNAVVQHGLMAFRLLCLTSCVTALFLYIRRH